jgi:hypothetical protein
MVAVQVMYVDATCKLMIAAPRTYEFIRMEELPILLVAVSCPVVCGHDLLDAANLLSLIFARP